MVWWHGPGKRVKAFGVHLRRVGKAEVLSCAKVFVSHPFFLTCFIYPQRLFRSNKIIAEKETELGDKQKHLIKSDPEGESNKLCNEKHVERQGCSKNCKVAIEDSCWALLRARLARLAARMQNLPPDSDSMLFRWLKKASIAPRRCCSALMSNIFSLTFNYKGNKERVAGFLKTMMLLVWWRTWVDLGFVGIMLNKRCRIKFTWCLSQEADIVRGMQF